MVLVSSPVVLCLGLDWVLLVSLDYNCSTAHFTNEQLSRRHTPLSYRWRATTTPAAKRSHCVKRHQLLCKSPLDYCEIKSKTHIVSEKYLKDKNMAQYAIFIWYKCSVQHFNPVAGPFFGVTLIQKVQNIASGVLYFSSTIAIGHVTCCLCLFASV